MSLLYSLRGDLGRFAGTELRRPTRSLSWCRYLTRRLATDASKKKDKPTSVKKSYSDSLNLPKSQFSMKHSRQLELEVEKRTQFNDLYEYERVPEPKGKFILHDGPPYANGDAHFGHCINKTLKDIFVKRQMIMQSATHYVPGWDCHGLPIELKAITEDQAQNLSPLEIRSRARILATEAIDRQRSSFSKWFLAGDLTRPYRTYDISYSLAELDAFYRLYSDGLIFRDYMPVYWSPSTRTALAEAELQYNAEHISRAAYIKYEIIGDHGPSTFAMIWTTTPWTLLANEGIAFNNQFDYSLVSLDPDSSEQFIVATDLVPVLQTKLPNTSITIKRSGIQLANLRYCDPLTRAEKQFLTSTHVSLNKGGTGLVHLAPNHGFDDYKLFQGNLPYQKASIVDNLGRLVLPEPFDPIPITTGDNLASNVVLEKILPNSVVYVEDYQHLYPYDWRSGKPVLIRPSSQWFLSIESIRQQCLDALDSVKMYPEKLRKEFRHQIASRPNWCLSRQRNWGVPIPVFYEKNSDQPVLTEAMFRILMDTFKKDGLDVWWSQTPEELLGESQGRHLVKGQDIFDIWFDSGCSWLAVLGQDQVADLYSEGIDQIRGWFQSSLITSVALRGTAPYKAIFIHGFSLDKEGKKMSKSLGNVIDPNDIVEDRFEKYLTEEIQEESKKRNVPKKKFNGTCGLDGLRFWIARHACNHNDVHVDVTDFREDILTLVNRMRNTFRFLLGVLKTENVMILKPEEFRLMPLMDRYLLMRIAMFKKEADAAFEDLNLGDLAEGTIRHLLYEVATFYLSRVKDRLYCSPKDSAEYRAAWTVLWYVYHTVGYQLGPILPHIILELNEQMKFRRSDVLESQDLDRFVKEVLEAGENAEEFQKKMTVVMKINETLNKWAGTSYRLMEYDMVVGSGTEEVLESLKFFQARTSPSFTSDLAELLQVASVSYQDNLFDDQTPEDSDERFRLRPSVAQDVLEGQEDAQLEVEAPQFEIELVRTKMALCPRCRRHTLDSLDSDGSKEDTLCDRCSGAV